MFLIDSSSHLKVKLINCKRVLKTVSVCRSTKLSVSLKKLQVSRCNNTLMTKSIQALNYGNFIQISIAEET